MIRSSLSRVFSVFKKPIRVHGHTVPARRFTGWALLYALLFIGVPVTLLGAGLDLVGWAVTVQLFGAECYGIGCLF